MEAQCDVFDRLDVVLGYTKIVGSLSGIDGPRLDLARVAGVASRGEGQRIGGDGARESCRGRYLRGDVGKQLGRMRRAQLGDERRELGDKSGVAGFGDGLVVGDQMTRPTWPVTTA